MTVKMMVTFPSWSPNPTDFYFWYSFVDDQHRNTNMNDKDHLVGQLTNVDDDDDNDDDDDKDGMIVEGWPVHLPAGCISLTFYPVSPSFFT